MNIQLTLTAASLSICLLSGVAQAAQTVVTFEDINTSPSNSPLYETGDIFDGYNGITGWNLVGQAWKYDETGVIGEKYFYGSEGELSFDNAPVVFEGTYYKSYAADPVNPITSIELYYQGLLVHSVLDPRAPLGLAWVASGYSGLVDKLYIRGGGEGFSIDNLTYSTAAVPEPETYAMFLVGLGLVGFLKCRQRVAS